MTRDESTPQAPPRRPYNPPAVRQVKLRPEDAVLAACKIPGQGCVPPGQPGGARPGS